MRVAHAVHRNRVQRITAVSRKPYSAPVLTRHGDVDEITATVAITGPPDNLTGLTRTGLGLGPAQRPTRPQHPSSD